MARISTAPLALAFPLAFLSQAALADLTPTEVWGDWKTYMQGMGYTIDATENASGGNLTVSDIKLGFPMPDDGGSASIAMGTLTFNQNADGSVAIVMPEVLPVVVDVNAKGPDAKPVKMTMSYSQTGHAMTASGSATDMTYDYTAQTIALKLDQLQVGPDSFGEENAKIDVTGTDLSSVTKMSIGDLRNYSQTGTIAAVNYDIFVNNPTDPNQVKLAGSMSNLTVEGGGTIPLVIPDASDMGAMLKAGFAASGTFTYTSGVTDIEVTDPVNGNFAAKSTSSSGKLGVEMGATGLSYLGSQNDLAMNVTAAGLPFPIDLSMAESGFNLKMPVSKSDEAQDFAFGITLGNFKMSDMIWGIFDPQGQLPRDPATIKLDLTGQAKLFADILDPEAAANMAGAAPGEVQSLKINNLQVDAVGAKLDGSGDFTFDNTDKTTFPGMPKPVGTVNLALVGGNALLDKIVAMGFVPQDQAMGVRMMMGLFAVPGDAPDSLKSKIDFTEDGQVLANGQRIK